MHDKSIEEKLTTRIGNSAKIIQNDALFLPEFSPELIEELTLRSLILTSMGLEWN